MNKKAHILVVSQYFYPEQFRINDICREWVRRGYRVTVLTGIPNYPQGKFYTGYGLCKKRKESWNGVEILRLPLVPRGKSSLGLILNYLSFPAAGFLWKCFTCVRADFVFNFETSPMTQSLVAVWYAKKRKIPCYLYVQDLNMRKNFTGKKSRPFQRQFRRTESFRLFSPETSGKPRDWKFCRKRQCF